MPPPPPLPCQSLSSTSTDTGDANDAGVRSIFWLKRRFERAPHNATYADFADIEELVARKANATDILRVRTQLDAIDTAHCSANACVYADRRLRVRVRATRYTVQRLIYRLCATRDLDGVVYDVCSPCPCPAYRVVDGQIEQQSLAAATVPNYELCCVNPHHCYAKCVGTKNKKRANSASSSSNTNNEVLVVAEREKFILSAAMEAEHRCALLNGIERGRTRQLRTQVPAKRPRIFDAEKVELYWQLALVDRERRRTESNDDDDDNNKK
jgi:hypothetical protein